MGVARMRWPSMERVLDSHPSLPHMAPPRRGRQMSGLYIAIVDFESPHPLVPATLEKYPDLLPYRQPVVFDRQHAKRILVEGKTLQDREFGTLSIETPIVDDCWRRALTQH